MLIKTTGKPSNISLAQCKEAVKFYGKMLLGNLYNKIELTIRFDNLKKQGAQGFCIWEDTNRYSREFTIEIDRALDKKPILLALAHEMVHVKQFAKGEMIDYLKSNKTRWKGKIIEIDKIHYWDQEWEIEAHGREMGLYVRFMEHVRSVK